MIEPLRLGFMGAGVYSSWAIYPALHFAPITLQAVCDRNEDKARAVAGKFGTGRWYTDYQQMWAREDLEAVIIYLKPGPRQRLVREALEAGYHVLIPKPPAMSLADSVELAETASQAGKTLMVDFQRRFSFGVAGARKIMADSSFGRLTQLHCSFCSGHWDEARSKGYEDSIQAFVLDFAVHHLDLARYLGGDVNSLAVFHNVVGRQAALAVALQFKNGAVGSLQLNAQRIWWRNYDRIEVTGQGQYVVIDNLWTIRHYTESANTFSENYSDERTGELTGDGKALIEFVAAIRENREPIASIRDCVGTMQLYEAVYGAVRAGQQGVIPLAE